MRNVNLSRWLRSGASIAAWASLFVTGIAAAQANECSGGVYIGKVGSAPFSMALDQNVSNSSEPRVGTLYYRSALTDLPLKREPGQAEWSEFDEKNKLSGRLTLQCQDKQLSGQWVSVDGVHHLPIVAYASPPEDYGARRLKALKPSKVRLTAIGGMSFESFVIAGPKMQGSEEAVVSGIRLLGTRSGIVKVNRLLWQESMDHVESALGCSDEFRRRIGENSPALSFEQNISEVLWPYAIVETKIGFECGWGMRYGVEKRTYQLVDGRKVDTAQWFQPELRELRDDKMRGSRLGKIILQLGDTQHHKDASECFEAAEYSVSDVYPSRQGLVFQAGLPTPFQFCSGAVDVTVPYARLRRYLSLEGKRALNAIELAIVQKPTP